MKFAGRDFRGSVGPAKGEFSIAKNIYDEWAVWDGPPRREYKVHGQPIGFVIISGRIIRFEPKLFKKGIILFTWYQSVPHLFCVDTVIEK